MTDYSAEDFAILAFPCNQFAHQEPGKNKSEILNGLKYVRPGGGFIPKFEIFMKIDVNGKDESPFYTYLKDSCPSPTDSTYDKEASFWNPIEVNDISWNFEKMLVDRSGRPHTRYLPDVEPDFLRPVIEALIGAQTIDEKSI